MSENVITITLDDVLGPDGMDGAWEAMTRRLADSAESKFIHSDAGKSFHDACVEAINEVVGKTISGKVEEMLLVPIPALNRFGEKVGEPKSFKDMLADAVETTMTETLDRNGNPPRPNNSAFGGEALTRTEWAIRAAVSKEIDKAIEAEVKKVKAEAADAIKDKMADMLAKHFKITA